MERSKRAYDICPVLYPTAPKNTIEPTQQGNKMPTKNGVVPTSPRVQVQISQLSSQQQQQETTKKKKKTLISETDEEEAVKKEIKTIKTLKEYFVNRSIVTLRNKEMTKKFITKINRNSKDVENEEKL